MPGTPKLIRSAVTPPISKRRTFSNNDKPVLNIPETTYHPQIYTRQVKQPTVPEPFNLPGEYFSYKNKEYFERLQQQEKQKFQEFYRFHASKMPSFYVKKQYVADEEMTIDDYDAAVTPGMFQNSEKRARERLSFELYTKNKQALLQELREREEDDRRRRDVANIQEIRKQMVPKICPYVAKKPFELYEVQRRVTYVQEFNLTSYKFRKPGDFK